MTRRIFGFLVPGIRYAGRRTFTGGLEDFSVFIEKPRPVACISASSTLSNLTTAISRQKQTIDNYTQRPEQDYRYR
jgi:hypothetical protein